jgi:hypothetical protein
MQHSGVCGAKPGFQGRYGNVAMGAHPFPHAGVDAAAALGHELHVQRVRRVQRHAALAQQHQLAVRRVLEQEEAMFNTMVMANRRFLGKLSQFVKECHPHAHHHPCIYLIKPKNPRKQCNQTEVLTTEGLPGAPRA